MKDLLNKIVLGDCLDIMGNIADKSVDMILCDLPYGTTACKWDVIIPFDKLWEQYNRIIKDNGAIVLTASQPFTSALIMSNIKMFKYEWIWIKNTQTGMITAGKIPMKKHENVLLFCKATPIFNEQRLLGSFISQNHSKKNYSYKNNPSSLYNVDGNKKFKWSEFIHANSILLCNSVGNRDKNKLHSTQKPVALMEYFINTYTNENEIVLDNCIGSGTTAIAAIRTGRQFIGIEKDPEYHRLATERVEKEKLNLFNVGD